MRVAILSQSGHAGGAAIAAHRLRQALSRAGIDAQLWTRDADGTSRDVLPLNSRWTRQLVRLRSPLVTRVGRAMGWLSRRGEVESVNLLPSGVRYSPPIARADVVNVHWMHREAASIKDLATLRRPLVITMHDMWWLLGTQHYREEPDHPAPHWTTQGLASQDGPTGPGADWTALDEWMVRRKQRWLPPQTTIVSPSAWLAGEARRSRTLGKLDIQVIPNALPLNTFRPYSDGERAALRARFGYPSGKVVLSFGALGVDEDRRKGARELAAALSHLARTEVADRVHLAVFGGRMPAELARLGLSCTEVGKITGGQTMAEFLNAVDVSVVPSRQENLPQTATEAIACGCPVVGFDVTGLPDVVRHGVTGLLARPYDPEAMAGHLKALVSADRADMRASAAAHARRHWDEGVVSAQYRRVYEAAAARWSLASAHR